MGNTTIIELNHDEWHDIFESETSQRIFLTQIQEQFHHYKHSGKKILGGRVIAGFHRSGKINDKWCNFKKFIRDNLGE